MEASPLEVGSPFIEGRHVQPPPAWTGSISCLHVTLHAGSLAPPHSSCTKSSCPLLTVFGTLRRGLTPGNGSLGSGPVPQR